MNKETKFSERLTIVTYDDYKELTWEFISKYILEEYTAFTTCHHLECLFRSLIEKNVQYPDKYFKTRLDVAKFLPFGTCFVTNFANGKVTFFVVDGEQNTGVYCLISSDNEI